MELSTQDPTVAIRQVNPSSPAKASPGRILVFLAVVMCCLLLGDCLFFTIVEGGKLRGVDYLLVAAAAGFLLLAWIRPARARPWSLMVLMIVAATLLLEATLTLISPGRAFPWHVWPPNLSREMTPVDLPDVGPSARFTTNSLGIRGPEISPQDQLRVLCVGGSTTECIYLDDAKTWAKLLGDRLSAVHGQVWVGNAGRSGLMTGDHLLYLTHAPEADLADVWVVLTGFNDLHYQLMNQYAAFTRSSWERTFVHRQPGLSGPWRRPFHRNLRLANAMDDLRQLVERRVLGLGAGAFQDRRADWVRDKRRERAAATITDEAPPVEGYLEEYRRQLQGLIHLSRAREKRLLLLTQPTLHSDPMPPEHEALTMGGKLGDGRYLSNRQRYQAMEKFNDVLRAVAAEHRIACVDLARLVPRTTEAFYDDCHFNEGGARLVAELVASKWSP